MVFRIAPLLCFLALAGCGTISERGNNRVDVLCDGWFSDMGTCHAAARAYCRSKTVEVLHDFSQDTPPRRRLTFACR